MERRPEPDSVEDVPDRLGDGLGRVLNRLHVHHSVVAARPNGKLPGVKVALMIEGQEGVTWEQWCALAEACEDHGIETLFRSDHYISQGDEDANVAHDAWTTIAALAARTTRLRFGTLVSPVTFRAPALLANAAATADHVSGGRIELGIGAGWMEREHRAFGFPFPETPVRVQMFAEQLEIVHRLWTEERVDFRGRHYTLEDAPGLPRPVQKPRPPILVGGSGGRGTVEPALRFADEYNTPFASPEEAGRIRAKVPSLRFSVMTGCVIGETHADAEERARALYGRRPREVSFDEWLAGFTERAVFGSVDEVAARLLEYEQAGCDRVMLQHLLHTDLDSVRLISSL
jgi:F420-dependent oxidoreductase-like protein